MVTAGGGSYAQSMQIDLTVDQEALLAEMAAHEGKGADELARENRTSKSISPLKPTGGLSGPHNNRCETRVTTDEPKERTVRSHISKASKMWSTRPSRRNEG
jgi:hypothetical protein